MSEGKNRGKILWIIVFIVCTIIAIIPESKEAKHGSSDSGDPIKKLVHYND